jgi:ABC-type branched-subunit amino acid transport system substrate-binding protein
MPRACALYFDQINKAGGVQGQPVQLVTVDDVGHPEETVDKTRKLLDESKPVVLAGYFGNRNMAALLDSKLLDQSQISLVGYQSTDTRVLSNPPDLQHARQPARGNGQDRFAPGHRGHHAPGPAA